MSLFHIVTLFSYLCLCSVDALASGDCVATADGTEICSVQVALSGKKGMYQYEIRRAQSGYPTVIKIPGGPGQGFIGQAKGLARRDNIPKEFGIITLDPRGVGKNDYGPDRLGNLYSTAHNVEDIEKVIKKEKLDSYIVHGQSYGTVVATEFGHSVSSGAKIPRPLGIILSGVAYDGVMTNYFLGFNEQLQRLMSVYSADEKANISAGLQKILEGKYLGNQQAFSSTLKNMLMVNIEDPKATRVQNMDFRRFFDLLAKNQMEADNPVYNSLIKSAKSSVNNSSSFSVGQRTNTMGEIIKCTEMGLSDNPEIFFDLENVKVTQGPPDCALKSYELKNKYQVRNFPIRGIPLYYVQGALDPATPLAGAKKHYGDQQQTQKIFIEISDQAHTGLFGLWECREKIWYAVSVGVKEVQDLLPQCASEHVKVRGIELSTPRRGKSAVLNTSGVQ